MTFGNPSSTFAKERGSQLRSILLDSHAWRKLWEMRRDPEAGRVPANWHCFVDELSRFGSGRPAQKFNWFNFDSERTCLFSWLMSPETIVAAMRGCGLIFLCWGAPRRTGWKGHVIRMVLERAEHLLVNDTTTQEEIYVLCGRRARVVPYFIDTKFFSFHPFSGRSEFLFCNGSNDRDPELLLGLAKGGFKVVWLVNDFTLRARYEGRHPNLMVRSAISFDELRTLYHTCAATIVPALCDRHCMGQTTSMEAIACGAPLIISQGRTATIFSGMNAVRTVESRDPGDWIATARSLLADPTLARAVEKSSCSLRGRVAKEALKAVFTPLLLDRCGQLNVPENVRTD